MNRRNQRIGYDRGQEAQQPQWQQQQPAYFGAPGQPFPGYQVYYDPYQMHPYAQPLHPYPPHMDSYHQQMDSYTQQQMALAQQMQYAQGGNARARQGGGRGRDRSGRRQQQNHNNDRSPDAQEAAQLRGQMQGMSLQDPKLPTRGSSNQQGALPTNGSHTHYATDRRSPTGRPPVFALDVECAATGHDEDCNVVLTLYVKPQQPVVSYLTELTGLTEEVVQAHGYPLEEALAIVEQSIPENAVLVSYNIDSDLQWLHLEHKVNRGEVQDLKGLYSSDPVTHRRKWKVYGQDHIHRTLIGETGEQHDAVGDAIKSMRLLQLYNSLKDDPKKFEENMEKLASTEKKPSFAMKHPIYDGVCMGNRQHCQCSGGKKGMFSGAGGGGLWVPPQPTAAPKIAVSKTPAIESQPVMSATEDKPSVTQEEFAADKPKNGSSKALLTEPREYREVHSD